MRFYKMPTHNEIEINNAIYPYNDYRNSQNRMPSNHQQTGYRSIPNVPMNGMSNMYQPNNNQPTPRDDRNNGRFPLDRGENGWNDAFTNYDPSYKLPNNNGFMSNTPPVTPIENLQGRPSEETLALIKSAIQGEKEDELFYEDLINMAPKQEDKDIIMSIRNDERNHNQYFRKIYKAFTGEDVQAPADMEYEKPENYACGVKKALFGELSAVEKYRKIREDLKDEQDRDILFEIITDELKHSAKYNYLYHVASK